MAQLTWTDYQQEKTLSAGFLARDGLGRQVVLKRLDSFVDPLVPEWLTEAWHPGIPRCLGQTCDETGTQYAVFTFLPGRTAGAILAEEAGGLPWQRVLPWLVQWARALVYLHQQNERALAHLDIKPDNLVVDGQDRAGLIDFGAARVINPGGEDQAKTHQALTRQYAAPEQPTSRTSPGSDLYALALTALVLLTGDPPERCRCLAAGKLDADMPDDLKNLLSRCLHADPARRLEQAGELARALERVGRKDQADQPAEAMRDEKPPEEARLAAPLLCVWDGPACGCELAAFLARSRDVLVIDANLLNPRADLLLGVPGHVYRVRTQDQTCGLAAALKAQQQGRLTPQALRSLTQETAVSRLRLLSGTVKLEDYEYVHLDSLHQVLKMAQLVTDLVMVLVNRTIFDAYTCLALMTADQIVLPLNADLGTFREVNRMVDFLISRHHLPIDRLHYVAFPYDPQRDLSGSTMAELCENHLSARISVCAKRTASRRTRPYAAALCEKNKTEYSRLADRLGLSRTPEKEGA